MSDCEHEFTLESIENPEGTERPGAIRTAWLRCTICDMRQSRMTMRTDAQIQAELDEIQTP